MERKNIFQLISENFNINDEIRKIDKLFKEEEFFYKYYDYLGRKTVEKNFTLGDMIEAYLFAPWKHRDTCINIEELFKRANAEICHKDLVIGENIITNYLEVMLNLIKLYKDNIRLLRNRCIENYSHFNDIFCRLVDTLKQHLGLADKIIDGAIVLFPENAALEQVLNLTPDESAQWELIRYCRENMDLAEKRKSLANFATVFYIEEDKDDDQATKLIVNKATNILNNLHIRHNNQTGKYEKEYLKDMKEKDALSLCDLLYNQILTIILLRDQRKYDEVYKSFKDKQKGQK